MRDALWAPSRVLPPRQCDRLGVCHRDLPGHQPPNLVHQNLVAYLVEPVKPLFGLGRGDDLVSVQIGQQGGHGGAVVVRLVQSSLHTASTERDSRR